MKEVVNFLRGILGGFIPDFELIFEKEIGPGSRKKWRFKIQISKNSSDQKSNEVSPKNESQSPEI